MQKSIKKLSVMIFATGMILSSTFTSLAAWEQQADGAWKYKDDTTNVYLSNGWQWLDGNNDGVAECYYLDNDGIMAVNTVVEGYTVNVNGAWTVDNIVQTKAVNIGHSTGNNVSQPSGGTNNSSSNSASNRHTDGLPVATVGSLDWSGECGDSTGLPPMEAGTGDNNSDNSDVHWIPDDVKGGNSGGFRPGTIIGG